jgi:hypothetical protein
MEKILIKIQMHNEEDGEEYYVLEVEIICHDDIQFIEKLIEKYYSDRIHRFNGAGEVIKLLKYSGFEAKEPEYAIEI